MKNKIITTTIILVVALLLGLMIFLPKEESLNEIETITMEIKENTLTSKSATIIIKDTSKEKNTFGEAYRIDKKVNNTWKELEPIVENHAFNLIGYEVNKDHELQLKVKWENLYGELSAGQYRIVKKVNNQYFSTEFIIK